APSLPGDVHALGGLLAWMLSGRPAGDETSPALGPALRALLDEMRAPQPSDRLSIQEVEERLALLRKGSSDLAATNARSPGSWPSGGTPPLLSDGSQEGRGRSLLARHLGAAPAADLLARGRLGRFRLLAKLGEGGMGAVYRAEDVGDGAVVAVK